jgi:NitT/TauT family transport system substrate-binding protein
LILSLCKSALNIHFQMLKRCLIVGLVLFGGLGLLSCSKEVYHGELQPLSIGTSHNESDSLLYISENLGFFSSNGLSVTLKDYSSGSAAMKGMLGGEVDIASSSEFVVVQDVFNNQPVSTLAVINRNYSTFLVGRTDKGVLSIKDLGGKTIGIPGGTAAQFYFGRMLELNGISMNCITMVNYDITKSVDLIINGDVDAELTWEPYVNAIKEKMGDKIDVWSAQSGQSAFKCLNTTKKWVSQHPDMAERLLKSLADAERYITLHPEQSKIIIQQRLSYDNQYIDLIWPSLNLSLSLNQSLIVAMEDEARWMIKNNMTTQTQVPFFNDYIYEDALKALKPEAVNIIR